jgi:outer membrane cobalamin receptor
VLTPVTNVLNQYLNTGENHASGVELTHSYHWQDWQFQGSGSYVLSKNRQNQTYYTTFPRYSINLGLGKKFASDWSVWLNQRMLLMQTTTDKLAAEPIVDAPDYYRTDMHVERQRQLWRYWLDVRNIFNRNNIIPALYNADGGIPDEKISALVGVERRW